MSQNIVRDDASHTGLASCLCTACAGDFDPRLLTDSTDEASLDPRAGETANNKPIWTPDQIAAYLNRSGGGFANGEGTFSEARNGRQNDIGDDGSVITFGFFNTVDEVARNGYTYTTNNTAGVPTLYGLAEVFNFAPFTVAQRAAAREAMQYWDDVVSVTFREASADDADMNFGNLASAPQTQAYARIPTAALDATLGGQVREIGGDSWYSASQTSNFQLDEGLYGMNTLTHEIGHAIGLSHPGQYNFGPGFSVNYTNGAEYAQDARNYSIMSYWNPRDLGTAGGDIATRDFDWSLMAIAYGATPMVHDILAAQRIYGVDTTTRAGDNTYGFNASGDQMRDAFDFEKTPWPTMAIWDAGGVDTIDASKFNVNQTINLNPGSLSSIGGVTYEEALRKLTFEQVNINRATAGYAPISRANYDANIAALAAQPDFRGRLTDNVGIAYGAIIENAVGGGGNDKLVANDVANVLNGGAGFDTVSYIGATDENGMTFNAATRTGSGAAAAGDTYIDIEAFEGTNFADVFTGSSAADTLGGAGGDDKITGGSGADTLFGGTGNDRLEGGNDNDTLNGDAGNDVLIGGNGADTLNGGDGDDSLDGGNDTDTLNGGAGADTLQGGNGNDVLNGGAGDDTLSGNLGSDIFLFTEVGGRDTVTDFRRGQDKIDLSDLDADTNAAGVNGFSFVGSGAFTKVAGQLRAANEGGFNVLQGDTNGDGVADFTIVTGSVLIGATDLILI